MASTTALMEVLPRWTSRNITSGAEHEQGTSKNSTGAPRANQIHVSRHRQHGECGGTARAFSISPCAAWTPTPIRAPTLSVQRSTIPFRVLQRGERSAQPLLRRRLDDCLDLGAETPEGNDCLDCLERSPLALVASRCLPRWALRQFDSGGANDLCRRGGSESTLAWHRQRNELQQQNAALRAENVALKERCVVGGRECCTEGTGRGSWTPTGAQYRYTECANAQLSRLGLAPRDRFFGVPKPRSRA